jgi:hypothetical protein
LPSAFACFEDNNFGVMYAKHGGAPHGADAEPAMKMVGPAAAIFTMMARQRRWLAAYLTWPILDRRKLLKLRRLKVRRDGSL